MNRRIVNTAAAPPLRTLSRRLALLGLLSLGALTITSSTWAQSRSERPLNQLEQKIYKLFEDSESIYAANKLYLIARGIPATDPNELVPYYLPNLPIPDENIAASLYMIEPPNTILVRMRPQAAGICSHINKKLGFKEGLREVNPETVKIGCIPTRQMTGYLFRYTREP